MGTNIKICGITSVDDAMAALDAGADYLGLIFAENSPRRVEYSAAKEIMHSVEDGQNRRRLQGSRARLCRGSRAKV